MKLPRHTRIPIIVAVLAPFLLAAGAGTALPLPARSRTPQASRHFTDLSAFVQELDKSYPFFDIKGLRKGWPAKKKQLLAKAMRCSSDQELIGLALETIRYLRDGHMGLVKVSAKMPEAKPEYCPGISFLPATKKRVVVMSTVESLSLEATAFRSDNSDHPVATRPLASKSSTAQLPRTKSRAV